MIKTATAIILGLVCTVSYQALGDEIEVKSLNRSLTGFFVFSPDFVRIKPGYAYSTGHQSRPVVDPAGGQC
jgi:hypothetical protein